VLGERAVEHLRSRYDEAPHLVFWETTKACSLACRHCRATAQPGPAPGELSSTEAKALIDEIAAFSKPSPILIFTGGDCFERTDLIELIDHARQRGVRMGVAPSVTARLTRERMSALLERGVRSVSISLDGATSATHDIVRGVAGHFDATRSALAMLADMGFRLQVNTTIMSTNIHELADVAATLKELGVAIWEAFFLVNVGRGAKLVEIKPSEAEEVCHFLVDASYYDLTVRTVEGPFFRRVQRQRRIADELSLTAPVGPLHEELRSRLVELLGPVPEPSGNPTLATGDGRGVVFIAHDGTVHSSGFMPVSASSVRERPLSEIYRDDALFRQMRRGDLIGPCGACDDRGLCGGSRARAFVATGNALGSDPLCVVASAMSSSR
jgi:radical SAM protein